jgi:Cysteine rich repeat
MNHSPRPQLAAIMATALVLAPGLATPAGAQAAGDMSPQASKACRADYRKLCPGVRPGEGRVVACFEDHLRELSPGCRAALRERAAEKRSH